MTQRRGNRPTRPPRPYKPIPVITEKYHGKPLTTTKAKLSLMQRLKKWGSRFRSFFGRRKKRRIETKTIKSKWKAEERIQAVADLSIHKAKKKARNRRNRKLTRTLHQAERRRA